MRMSKIAWGIVTALALGAAPALADEPAPAKADAKVEVKAKAKTKVAKKKAPPKEAAPKEEAPAADPAPAAEAADGAAEVKVGTGINKKKREVVGEADSFEAGSKVWVWSKVEGAKDKTIVHVWKRDDRKLMGKEFVAKSNKYRTWSALRVKPGSYTVEVQDEGGAVLGSVSFTVAGEVAAK